MPLSWPPPGLERLQGDIWLVIGLAWAGGLILVLPLLWALAIEPPFYSLGPFEENWELGVGIAVIGAVLVMLAFGHLLVLVRASARAADMGYGLLTILEIACDARRDTGFLIQGRRHFGGLDGERRAAVVRQRLWGAGLLLSAAIWLVMSFGLSILLAARGFVTPSGIWLLPLAPAAVMTAISAFLLVRQNTTVRQQLTQWNAQEGANRVHTEAAAWNAKLDEAGDSVALGAGERGEVRRFSLAAAIVVVAFVLAFAPATTIAITTAIGPVLAEIAVPAFLSVQEMAGGAEALRRFRVEADAAISAAEAGMALQSLAFVGTDGRAEPHEREPARLYAEAWFPDASLFPDPFSETIAYELMRRPLSEFSPDERAALQQAAVHPAQTELDVLAHAQMIDVVSGRWALPFPDSMTFHDLPWPRFPALRAAGLARVAKAAVEASNGQDGAAQETLMELMSTGFLLIDEGPTLIDNLMGVQMTRVGADALEGYYERAGRNDEAASLEWARDGALRAAEKARAGLTPEDVRALLQGVPDLVENEEALRGLRWEYFATFNVLAPCINLHKMVFGPDETYAEWRRRAERSIVRVPGEQALFDLAGSGVLGTGGQELRGLLPRFLSLVLGSHRAPGSCASLIASLAGR
jgi:hypothetical protein